MLLYFFAILCNSVEQVANLLLLSLEDAALGSGFRWAVNVGRWMPQGGAEGDEFKMLLETQRTTALATGGPWTFGPLTVLLMLLGAVQAIASSLRRTRTGDAVPSSAHA